MVNTQRKRRIIIIIISRGEAKGELQAKATTLRRYKESRPNTQHKNENPKLIREVQRRRRGTVGGSFSKCDAPALQLPNRASLLCRQAETSGTNQWVRPLSSSHTHGQHRLDHQVFRPCQRMKEDVGKGRGRDVYSVLRRYSGTFYIPPWPGAQR